MNRRLLHACVVVVAANLSGCCHFGGDDESYDPCEEKEEGDPCQLCPPDDPECTETAVIKVCDEVGECSSGVTTSDHEVDDEHAHHH